MTRAWKPAWFAKGTGVRAGMLWRGVEAQHVVSTMRLADDLGEQRVLEELLEASKPALPPEARGRHYLIFTPFRYRSPIASRFRRPQDPGVWYGAEELETACGEVAYWKWRFLVDSDVLVHQTLLTQHTFFEARVRGRCADLTSAPWRAAERAWRRPSDYSACQDLADEARRRDLAWLRYASVRVAGGHCGAVLTPVALALGVGQQPWVCKTARRGAYLQRVGGEARYALSAKSWE